jgi:hypothetical protein
LLPRPPLGEGPDCLPLAEGPLDQLIGILPGSWHPHRVSSPEDRTSVRSGAWINLRLAVEQRQADRESVLQSGRSRQFGHDGPDLAGRAPLERVVKTGQRVALRRHGSPIGQIE